MKVKERLGFYYDLSHFKYFGNTRYFKLWFFMRQQRKQDYDFAMNTTVIVNLDEVKKLRDDLNKIIKQIEEGK